MPPIPPPRTNRKLVGAKQRTEGPPNIHVDGSYITRLQDEDIGVSAERSEQVALAQSDHVQYGGDGDKESYEGAHGDEAGAGGGGLEEVFVVDNGFRSHAHLHVTGFPLHAHLHVAV